MHFVWGSNLGYSAIVETIQRNILLGLLPIYAVRILLWMLKVGGYPTLGASSEFSTGRSTNLRATCRYAYGHHHQVVSSMTTLDCTLGALAVSWNLRRRSKASGWFAIICLGMSIRRSSIKRLRSSSDNLFSSL